MLRKEEHLRTIVDVSEEGDSELKDELLEAVKKNDAIFLALIDPSMT